MIYFEEFLKESVELKEPGIWHKILIYHVQLSTNTSSKLAKYVRREFQFLINFCLRTEDNILLSATRNVHFSFLY